MECGVLALQVLFFCFFVLGLRAAVLAKLLQIDFAGHKLFVLA